MSAFPWILWGLPTGLALDAIVGDPRGWPHPVRLIGALIRATERVERAILGRLGRRWLEYPAGIVLLATVSGATGLTVWWIEALGRRNGKVAAWVVESLLVYWALAMRSLVAETFRASEEADLDRARSELSMIVGRDTESLDRPEICRACVETVSENCNDAVIAPLFWYAIAGPVGLWVYKAVNTLDSMVGYRDVRYERMGWASARCDDLLNLLPARLTWLLLSLAAAFVGERGGDALLIGWRDGRKHPSPNAAWGEAAMAGALGVQLGGPISYRGIAAEKPRLGDPGETIGPETVRRAVRVMVVASLFAAALAWATRIWLFGSD